MCLFALKWQISAWKFDSHWEKFAQREMVKLHVGSRCHWLSFMTSKYLKYHRTFFTNVGLSLSLFFRFDFVIRYAPFQCIHYKCVCLLFRLKVFGDYWPSLQIFNRRFSKLLITKVSVSLRFFPIWSKSWGCRFGFPELYGWGWRMN